MDAGKIKIAVWSNNSFVEDSFVGQTSVLELDFKEFKTTVSTPYFLAIIDLDKSLSNVSQQLIDLYSLAREKDQKLAVILLHGAEVDTEKNLYFQELLGKMGGDRPLHRLVIVKDLFQVNLLYSETYLEKYILEAIADRKIIISVKGENTLFPISFSDITNCLKKILFLQGTAGKTFWVLGDPVTDLEIAYLIKKNLEDTEGAEFEIDATGENQKLSLDLNALGNQTRAMLTWEPKEEFSSSLKDAVHRLSEDRSLLLTKLHHNQKQNGSPAQKTIEKYFRIFTKTILTIKLKKKEIKNIETSRQLLRSLFERLLILATSVYLILTVSFIMFTSLSLRYVEKTLFVMRRGDIATSVKYLKQSRFFSKIGEDSYSAISPLISLIADDIHEKNYNLFIFLHYSQSSLVSLQQTYQLAESIYRTIGDTSKGQFYIDSSLALRSNLSQVYENLNQIELLSGQGKLPKILQDKISSSPEFKNLKLIEQQITDLLKTIELIPAFLAGDSAKNIVILFQNSQEIRSTGGAIDYILALVLDQGRVVSKNIYRSDEIDKLAVGIISAPPFVSQFTGLSDWKMRDLNYNPDFPQTATNVSWFIEKTLKFKPDIIMAMNDKLISSLLIEDKGVMLQGQNITADSFRQELRSVSPSSLYRDLINYYLDGIFNHTRTLVSLGRVIAKQSDENQLLFWSADDNVEESIITQSFAGALYPHSCHGGLSNVRTCIAQTTYLNESNYSLLPLSDILERKTLHTVWLEPDIIRHEYHLQYQFKDKITNQNRDINELFQIYAPQNSTLDQVQLDDKILSLRLGTEQQDNDLKRFQFPISFTLNQPHNLIFRFSTRLSNTSLLPYAYSLTEYHQPGISNQYAELNINIPETARPATITSPVSTGPNSLKLVMPAKTTTFGVSLTVGSR
ncbi:hypothetical protein A3K29_01115 [Candidatus Collierbacteria bacterium RIFOXYB2_FULL_46_14]|uniref:Tetratricopeptide TPR_2 repeat protein n=1 Tax=Candidatus Collierbacteria bacterium GW2011_GWA2_46_26 TaxID=1618381 RepID=A0A0G1PKQ3_9BACT|nr:MAG: Tetratricopeptide TPR_2 repeat protein [Candidatus Collierbacteria bacterium GW2011_GWC2_44_13]KKU33311.1 MAG: Tetratricopeptide TPR_2 repeat protein [Candidatus Collierbacteria bacterium GW2011_GWA2_46_26]OGD72731.1 MAG: hypothetical protein A3K29_01115 [Candidatus Collierbacteria bacterium RIFOXYB2_FULL_46_14]OGD75773.1 MAG: hypothetical protein A3K43_01115 [Candidatus Collierbacteria bacterium RIFOXYA2_FULL_46_20]OGD77109.1 MAG: hypothetical protein A3K39_01115 [Candidatus Collierbac